MAVVRPSGTAMTIAPNVTRSEPNSSGHSPKMSSIGYQRGPNSSLSGTDTNAGRPSRSRNMKMSATSTMVEMPAIQISRSTINSPMRCHPTRRRAVSGVIVVTPCRVSDLADGIRLLLFQFQGDEPQLGYNRLTFWAENPLDVVRHVAGWLACRVHVQVARERVGAIGAGFYRRVDVGGVLVARYGEHLLMPGHIAKPVIADGVRVAGQLVRDGDRRRHQQGLRCEDVLVVLVALP